MRVMDRLDAAAAARLKGWWCCLTHDVFCDN